MISTTKRYGVAVANWTRRNTVGILGFCAVSAWWLVVGAVVACWLGGN